MDKKLTDSIYDMVKTKLNYEQGPFSHSQIEDCTRQISNLVFSCNDQESVDYVVARYEENHPNVAVSEPDVLIADPTAGKWFEKKKEIMQNRLQDGYFKRYRSYLQRKDFDDTTIDQLELDCERVLKQCANPEITIDVSERKKKGLVVGDVQSGKTANYTGLINLACDYGYKIIVLLAGMTDSLRQQTQSRIDEGLIGAISDTIGNSEITYVGVSECEVAKQHHAVPLTNNENDFVKFVKKNLNATSGDFNKPIILVVKKNTSVLDQVCKWLKAGTNNITSENILIIDDEADNASVNTKKPELDPSTINGHIRNLFNNFPIASYVGYTATPFANVFVNPDGDDAYKDLFPSDFIVLLNAPSNYFGATKVFSYEGENVSRYIRRLDESEPNFLPPKHKKDEFRFTALPESMKEAILCFLLNNVIMTIRGKNDKHRSMLINISVFNPMHEQIKEVVVRYIENIKYVIEQDSFRPLSEFVKNLDMYKLHGIYEGYPDCIGEEADFYKNIREKISWDEIQAGLYNEITKIEVSIFNNKNKKNRFSYLDSKYETVGARVIAIGGYVLSRGLTLEGLMVSYFSRNSSAYDSLLQMCRWFGYRPGYEDLCRIYISPINIMNFRAVIDAVENLKMQFREMIVKKKKPEEFGFMVQESPDTLETSLLITSRNKMYNTGSVVHVINYGGTYADTSKLYYDGKTNVHNKECVDQLIDLSVHEWQEYMAPGARSSHLMARNVSKASIAKCIRQLIIPYENTKFDVENLADYIERNATFDVWDIVIASGGSDMISYENHRAAKRTFRKRPDEKIIRIGDTNNRIIDPNIFGCGLTEDEWTQARNHAKNRVEKTQKGNPDNLTVTDYLSVELRNPLFVVYPMELLIPDTDNNEEKKVIDLIDKTIPMFGFAVGFPSREEAEKMKYRANKIKIREIESSRNEPEIDEEFEDND